MKKSIILFPIAFTLAACGTFGSKDPYERRVEEDRERQEKYVERTLDKAPKWMTELPTSTGAIYQNGTAVSGDFTMADSKAKMFAFGKICTSAGGTVSQQGKIFMQDTQSGTVELSELAIKSMCSAVDITGVEIKEIKRISEGTRYRSYVLVALPVGTANPLQLRKDNIAAQKRAETRSTEAFKEIQKQDASKPQ